MLEAVRWPRLSVFPLLPSKPAASLFRALRGLNGAGGIKSILHDSLHDLSALLTVPQACRATSQYSR